MQVVVPDYRSTKGRLPNYATFGDALKVAIEILKPSDKLTVTEAAEKHHRIVNNAYTGYWDRKTTPYMVEPQDMTDSRRYNGVVFVGPARTGKTLSLVQNVIIKRMVTDPCVVHVTQMDQLSAKRFSAEKLNPMLRHCPNFRKQLISRGDSLGNVYEKQFRGSGILTIGWPVGSQLASRDIQLTLATDYDKMPENVEGEGDVWTLQKKRNQTFMSLGMSVAESSPRKEVQDPDWSPGTIHEAPPCDGILGLYNLGTRARYYCQCLHCSTLFEADYKHLQYEQRDSIQEMAETVYLKCPDESCGGVMLPTEKQALFQPENGAKWLHESKTGELVPVDDLEIRPAQHVSYWLKGIAAAYQNWQSLVANFLSAEAAFAATGDETKLRSTLNVDQGHPYLPRSVNNSMELNAAKLIARASFRELGVVPEGVRFITIQVDVQSNRFVVQVEGHGIGLETWLIDRFDISVPPSDAPGVELDKDGNPRRTVQPHLYEEDWDVLADLHDRAWFFENGETGLKPRAVLVDNNGMPGVTPRARRFWRKQRRRGLGKQYYIYSGTGNERAPRAKLRKPDNQSAKKRYAQLEVEIVFGNTNLLKDEVISSLVREESGPLCYHIPETLPANIVEEFCAEHRVPDKGWKKKKAHFRNESLDLSVMGRSLLIVIGAEKINWKSPVSWAGELATNPYAVKLDGSGKLVETKTQKSGGASLAEARKAMMGKNK